MKRCVGFFLAITVLVSTLSVQALAAAGSYEVNSKNSFFHVEDFQRYYNAIILSSASDGVEAYALGVITADLDNDGFYAFDYAYGEGFAIQGKVNEDGKLYGMGVVVNTDSYDHAVYAKYMLFASIAATQFKEDGAVFGTADILKNLGMDMTTGSFGASKTTEYTKGYINYKLTVDSSANRVYLSIKSTLTGE